jgi:hypothetical protein
LQTKPKRIFIARKMLKNLDETVHVDLNLGGVDENMLSFVNIYFAIKKTAFTWIKISKTVRNCDCKYLLCYKKDSLYMDQDF